MTINQYNNCFKCLDHIYDPTTEFDQNRAKRIFKATSDFVDVLYYHTKEIPELEIIAGKINTLNKYFSDLLVLETEGKILPNGKEIDFSDKYQVESLKFSLKIDHNSAKYTLDRMDNFINEMKSVVKKINEQLKNNTQVDPNPQPIVAEGENLTSKKPSISKLEGNRVRTASGHKRIPSLLTTKQRRGDLPLISNSLSKFAGALEENYFKGS